MSEVNNVRAGRIAYRLEDICSIRDPSTQKRIGKEAFAVMLAKLLDEFYPTADEDDFPTAPATQPVSGTPVTDRYYETLEVERMGVQPDPETGDSLVLPTDVHVIQLGDVSFLCWPRNALPLTRVKQISFDMESGYAIGATISVVDDIKVIILRDAQAAQLYRLTQQRRNG